MLFVIWKTTFEKKTFVNMQNFELTQVYVAQAKFVRFLFLFSISYK